MVWTRVTNNEGPCQRSLHVSAVWRDKMICFGGYDGGSRVNDCWEFDFTKRQWSPIRATSGSPPSPRDRHVGVVWGSSFYVFGGFDGTSRVNDFHEFSFGSSSWAPVRAVHGHEPSPRHSHAAIVYEDSMFVFGGYDGSYRCDFHEFNFVSCSWSPIQATDGRSPRARYRATCVCVDHNMYLFGGHDGTRHLNDVHVFDIPRRRWAELQTEGPAPLPRDSHAAVAHGRSMYVFGGSTGTAMNDFHELRLDTRTWAPVNQSPSASTATPSPPPIAQSSSSSAPSSTASTPPPVPPPPVAGENDNHHAAAERTGQRATTTAAPIAGNNPGGGIIMAPGAQPYRRQRTFDATDHNDEDARPGAAPGARFCHVAVVYEDSIYVFGGYDGQARLNDFVEFPLGKWWGDDSSYLDDDAESIGPSSLVADLGNLVDSPVLSDVVFCLDDGDKVFAHKVLCLRCPYFKAMLGGRVEPEHGDQQKGTAFAEATAAEIRIVDVKKHIFLCVLEYLYTDACDVQLDVAMELFQAADRFGVDRLKKMCEAKMLASIHVENACAIFHAADQYTARNLREKCLRFILHNFDDVTQTPAFEDMGRLNVDLVFDILRARANANPFASTIQSPFSRLPNTPPPAPSSASRLLNPTGAP